MPTLRKFTILFDRHCGIEKFYFYFVRHCFGTSEKNLSTREKKRVALQCAGDKSGDKQSDSRLIWPPEFQLRLLLSSQWQLQLLTSHIGNLYNFSCYQTSRLQINISKHSIGFFFTISINFKSQEFLDLLLTPTQDWFSNSNPTPPKDLRLHDSMTNFCHRLLSLKNVPRLKPDLPSAQVWKFAHRYFWHWGEPKKYFHRYHSFKTFQATGGATLIHW